MWQEKRVPMKLYKYNGVCCFLRDDTRAGISLGLWGNISLINQWIRYYVHY